MLRENPQLRPNVYQVVREVCAIRGTEVPIKDVRYLVGITLIRANASRSTPTVHAPKPEVTNSCRRLNQTYLRRQSLAFKRLRKCNRLRVSSQTSRRCDEVGQQHPVNNRICLPKELPQDHEGRAQTLLPPLTLVIRRSEPPRWTSCLPSTHPWTSSRYYTTMAPSLNSANRPPSTTNKKRFRNASRRRLQTKHLASQYKFGKRVRQRRVLVLLLQRQHPRREQSRSNHPFSSQRVVHCRRSSINPHRSDPRWYPPALERLLLRLHTLYLVRADRIVQFGESRNRKGPTLI